LAEINIPPDRRVSLRQLMTDHDEKIVMLACKICLTSAPMEDRKYAVRRLIELLPHADWMLAQDIEDCLVSHFDQAKDIIGATIQREDALPEHDATRDRTTHALLHIKARAEATLKSGGNHR
jgi:hypothetical protein